MIFGHRRIWLGGLGIAVRKEACAVPRHQVAGMDTGRGSGHHLLDQLVTGELFAEALAFGDVRPTFGQGAVAQT